ncbi:MAG TPA: LuxR C-terminal-related transcriptional regulator [Acidobacteriaceae bacterium]|nr:LuxR C-terminal-related transcriptional regulator [Acidobacteriaceae bacterium]
MPGEVELKACLNDLMGILTLPALWTGREQDQVIQTLVDAVRRTLDLEFAYARLNLPDGRRIERMRVADSESAIGDEDNLRRRLRQWLGDRPKVRSMELNRQDEENRFALAAFSLGPDEQAGVLVAGSYRTGFPSNSERLLLNVAANQAATGLREAQLLGDQHRTAQELRSKTTRQKKALAAANHKLEKENGLRKAAEQALRTLEERLDNPAQAERIADENSGLQPAKLRENYARLSRREREVLPSVVAGRLSKQIAADLGISEITIRVHRGQIMRKMQAQSLAELIRMTDRLGIR